MNDSCTIDGFGPLSVQPIHSVGELGDAVRRAAAEGQAVYPLGGRTQLDLGLPPTRAGFAVDMRGLDQVIDYPARDMTVTVQSGITLGRLAELLRAENQRLPIDVPRPDEATLGGAIAANVSGPRRHGFGTLRDYVIGISVVNDEGQETKAGGRVVKNVAGYDLCKLHVGALGTLGIVSQVTLKLRPRTEASALCILGVGPETLASSLDRVHQSPTRPVCVELLNQPAATPFLTTDAPWTLIVGFEDNAACVAWQVERLQQDFADAKIDVRRDGDAEPIWHALRDLPAAPLAFKANVLPHAVAGFCSKAASLGASLRLQAHAGNGVILGHADDFDLERAEALLKALRDEATAAQGNLVVTRCPSDWKKTLPVWGAPRGDAWLMKVVKDRLDPRNLFNPGRMP